MSLKCNKRLFVRTVPRNILVILLLAILCAFSIWLLYDFSRPRIYRATLTFSLSDSVGKPLPIHKQNSILASLFSQSVPLNDSNLHSFSSNTFQKKDFHENIRLSRNGDFIDLTFEAGSFEAARRGLETWFSAFSQAIIKQKKKLLLTEQHLGQQYDKTEILNIVQGFRSSFDSFIYQNVKQSELNDFSVQLTQATFKRIHLASLNSTINMIRENGQSLLSLSFIANNPMISALESKRDLLETQRAHMVVQLGWTHPQIKAMTAELEVISHQLEKKILQIIDQVHSDEALATELEQQLKKRISFFVKEQSQSLKKMFNELENKIRAVVDTQNKEMSKDSLLLQNTKIHMVVPTTLVPLSFIALYGKNVIISVFAGLVALLAGLFLFHQCSGIKKDQQKEDDFKNDESALDSKGIKSFESFITIGELSDFLKYRASTVVSIIGTEAARTAAKLSLLLIKERKTILLVDISGQQIEKVIGPHRGMSDILTGNAQFQDVIYRDYDTGVDILPQGLTSAVCAQDFSNDIPNLLQEFKKDYDFIILEMASEPKYGFDQFAELTDYYICSISLNEQDWMTKMVNRFPKTIYRVVAS
ncbi:membrane protein [Bartonella vinsonii]|uniref:Putative membrane protein n=1 Tax=Bartonella vinsonii subsp. berkhoffii str. Tweed TaxID=1094502 RepID=N6VN64_BARVB|nr:membrane protein [Bartonella vinsonii]ENN94601.1 putative membrane protein [Bartonella vinsonii subsp. berkhoffii str. Tweed]